MNIELRIVGQSKAFDKLQTEGICLKRHNRSWLKWEIEFERVHSESRQAYPVVECIYFLPITLKRSLPL